MRILQVNKYLYRRAGAEAYVLDWAELLIKHGQETGLWGTEAFPCHSEGAQRLKNPVHKGTGSFASAQDDVVIFNDLLVEERHFDQREGFWRDIKKVGHMIWSWESVRKFEEVLQRFKPDIVHIHNIYHHISPSILPMAKRFGVPVVMTVHDYHLINPNYNLYDHGEICERKGIYAIAHKCIKDSYAASFADVLEWGIHKMLRVYDNNVARYVVPTEFVKEKLVEQGIGGRHIEVVPLPVILNGVQCSEEFRANARDGRTYMRDSLLPAVAQNDSNGGYVLFAGRITREKGVYLLLEMAKKLPEMQFKIAGTGPELTNVKLKIKNEKLENIELLGFLEKAELREIIDGARLVAVPSLWPEPSPFAVLEAQAAGKVVLASRIGGIQNLIEDGKTGFLVTIRKYENTTKSTKLFKDWVDKVREIYYDETRLKQIGQAAREYIKKTHDPEEHYAALFKVYKEVTRND